MYGVPADGPVHPPTGGSVSHSQDLHYIQPAENNGKVISAAGQIPALETSPPASRGYYYRDRKEEIYTERERESELGAREN